MDVAITVAIVYIVLCAAGLILNILTIRAIVAHGMLKKAYSNMYILYLQPLITDILFQLLYMGYVAPAIIVQDNHPLGQVVSYILDSGQSYCFFNNSLSQISLAVNRLVVTVFLRMDFFNHQRTVLISIAQHLLAIVITVTANYAFPCCLQVLEFSIFNFRTVIIPGIFNYSLYWIRQPIKIACSAIPFLIYCTILLSTRSISRQAKLQSGELSRRRRQELRFASQFAILAVIYTLSWVLFTLLPVSAVSSSNWAFGLPAVISLVNSSANAIVFIINDRKRLCFVCKSTTSTQGGSSVQNSNKNSLKNKTTEMSSMNQSTYFDSEVVVVSMKAPTDTEMHESQSDIMAEAKEENTPRLRRGSARKSYANMDLDDDRKKDKTVFCSINRKRSVSRKPEIQEEPKRGRLDLEDPLIGDAEEIDVEKEKEDEDEDRESREEVPTTMRKTVEETDTIEEEEHYRAWVVALKDETLTEYAQRQFDETQLKLRSALSKVQKMKGIVTIRQNGQRMSTDVLEMCGEHLKLTEGTMEEMRLFETEDSSEDEDENPLSLASKRFQEAKAAHESAEKKVKDARGFLLVAETKEEWAREAVERANVNVEVWRATLEEYMKLDLEMGAERKTMDEEIDRVKNMIEVEMEKERKKKEDEENERKRREGEEMKNMEDLEIEMKKKEEEIEEIRKMIEAKKMEKMEEEEKKKLEEEKERKEEEEKKRSEDEMKKRIEEEVKKRVEEELKIRVEQEIKKRFEEEEKMRKEEEEKMRREETEKMRKEEQEKMRKEEDEKMRKEEEERNRTEEEENIKKEEEERNRIAQELQRIFREGEMKKKAEEEKLRKNEEEKEEKERTAREFKRIMDAGNEENKRKEEEKRREEENKMKMDKEERERIEEECRKFKEERIKKRREEEKRSRMEEIINGVAHNNENQPPPPKKQRRSNRKSAANSPTIDPNACSITDMVVRLVESANSPVQEPEDEITIEYEDVVKIVEDVITLD